MSAMTLVVIESPYAGDVERNLTYVRRAMRWCLDKGLDPFASHLLYTQDGVLDDDDPEDDGNDGPASATRSSPVKKKLLEDNTKVCTRPAAQDARARARAIPRTRVPASAHPLA